MDSLTQIVLGAAVGEAVLGKKVGNKALLYGAIGGTIPDLDIVFRFFTDTITATELHRGFSHSIVFCVLLSPILGWLVNKMERKKNLGWKPWAVLFFWCLFTHPLLDAFTTWGTQLFWPFDIRLAFNTIFVIDPLYTLPFLVCCIGVLFSKRESQRRRRFNRLGLIISTSYLMLTLVLKFFAFQKIESELEAQGIEYTAMSTRPAPMNTILWNANIDTKDQYLITDYSFFDTKPLSFQKVPKNRKASDSLAQKTNVQRLIAISEGWYVLEKQEDDWFFNDLRFGQIPKKDGSKSFVFSYLLEEENGRIKATELRKTERDAQFLMQSLWKRIQGN
jgi:inner membrane protein